MKDTGVAEAPVITALREICEQCHASPTNAYLGENQFRARHMDRTMSVEARYGLMSGAETIGKGLVIADTTGSLDGAVKEYFEIIPGRVQSRVTNGGKDYKTECFIDTQPFQVKSYEKYMKCEVIYIHRKFCMKNYIGTILQGRRGQSAGGFPVFIGSSDSLQSIAENTDLAVEMFMYDAHSFFRGIDGCNVLGNFTGEGKDLTDGSALAQYPHWDGIIKQILQNDGGVWYPEVTLDLPVLEEGQMYWMNWSGNSFCFETADKLVEGLNAACVDVSGEFPFAASYKEPTLNIVGTIPTSEVYGTFVGLEIFVAESLDGCVTSLPATVVQCPMDYVENGIICDYNEIINCENFHDYFLAKMKMINKHCLSLSQNGMDPNIGYAPFVIDPLLLIDMEVDVIKRLCACLNGGDQTNAIQAYLPDFVGLEVLKGTGLWYWGPVDNFIFNTTADDHRLGNFKVGYDEKCEEVYTKMNAVGGITVMDFGKCATNAKNSPFSKKLLPPQTSRNLPHACPKLRQDCYTPFCSKDENATVKAGAEVTLNPAEVEGGDCTIFLDDNSLTPAGVEVASVVWTLNFAGADPLENTDGENVEITLTPEQCDSLVTVEYEITTDTGEVKSVKVPVTDNRAH